MVERKKDMYVIGADMRYNMIMDYQFQILKIYVAGQKKIVLSLIVMECLTDK